MKYETYLKNKNLAKGTIQVYLKNYLLWKQYLGDNKANKRLFVNYINQYEKQHKPASVHLMYSSILSILRYEKQWKLLNECKDIKLPKAEITLKKVIGIEEFNAIKNKYVINTWYDKRNWMIFTFMFFTGIRVSELININLKDIKNHILIIYGKGKKTRNIYINGYLMKLIKHWRYKRIAISRNNKSLTIKQINLIIKNITFKYLNQTITSHGLRRSYATNLIKSNVNLEIIRKVLGHTNINTTSRYIQYTDEEILRVIKNFY